MVRKVSRKQSAALSGKQQQGGGDARVKQDLEEAFERWRAAGPVLSPRPCLNVFMKDYDSSICRVLEKAALHSDAFRDDLDAGLRGMAHRIFDEGLNCAFCDKQIELEDSFKYRESKSEELSLEEAVNYLMIVDYTLDPTSCHVLVKAIKPACRDCVELSRLEDVLSLSGEALANPEPSRVKGRVNTLLRHYIKVNDFDFAEHGHLFQISISLATIWRVLAARLSDCWKIKFDVDKASNLFPKEIHED